MSVLVDRRAMARAQIVEGVLSAAPRLHAALKRRFEGKQLEVEICSANDIEVLMEEASTMTAKELRRAKFRFVRDNGCLRNYYLEPTTRVFYRESEGKVFVMWNSCYAESNVAVAFPAENCDETFFQELERRLTGGHQSRRRCVRVPTRAGESCRG